jgi:hypothetical protein
MRSLDGAMTQPSSGAALQKIYTAAMDRYLRVHDLLLLIQTPVQQTADHLDIHTINFYSTHVVLLVLASWFILSLFLCTLSCTA